jgi:hypothetical protein
MTVPLEIFVRLMYETDVAHTPRKKGAFVKIALHWRRALSLRSLCTTPTSKAGIAAAGFPGRA